MCDKISIKDSCGKKTPAVCVFTEVTVNPSSSEVDNMCLVVEEALQDIYDQLGSITEAITIDKAELCLTYTEAEPTLLEVIKKHDSLLCALESTETTPTDLSETDITGWGLDFGCLEEVCGEPITTMKILLQSLIDKTCQLCNDCEENEII